MTAVSENSVPMLRLGNLVSIWQMHAYLPYTMEVVFYWETSSHDVQMHIRAGDRTTQNWGRWEKSRMILGLVCAGQRLASSSIAHWASWKKDGLLDWLSLEEKRYFVSVWPDAFETIALQVVCILKWNDMTGTTYTRVLSAERSRSLAQTLQQNRKSSGHVGKTSGIELALSGFDSGFHFKNRTGPGLYVTQDSTLWSQTGT